MRRTAGDAGRGDFEGVRSGIERWRQTRRGGEGPYTSNVCYVEEQDLGDRTRSFLNSYG